MNGKVEYINNLNYVDIDGYSEELLTMREISDSLNSMVQDEGEYGQINKEKQIDSSSKPKMLNKH